MNEDYPPPVFKKNNGYKAKFSIDGIVKDRVSLQNIKKILHQEFNISEPVFPAISNKEFFNKFNEWPEEKKHKFLVTIGGPINYEKTKKYLRSLQIYTSNKSN